MKLSGKYLVRKKRIKSGEEVVMIVGVFLPNDFSLDSINDDEMWVSRIEISDGIRFTEPIDVCISPEDFLLGKNQNKEDWKNKTTLNIN